MGGFKFGCQLQRFSEMLNAACYVPFSDGQLAKMIVGEGLMRRQHCCPAEMRPGLVEVMAGTPGVAPYFDLSFQHASGPLLRRMRRFGDADNFLELIGSVRSLAPTAGIRSNVIVGFPGETEDDLEVLADFLTSARLDVVGVFGYSNEDGTEAADLGGQLPEHQIEERRRHIDQLVESLVADRADSLAMFDHGPPEMLRKPPTGTTSQNTIAAPTKSWRPKFRYYAFRPQRVRSNANTEHSKVGARYSGNRTTNA